jgi:hypothetical protein
MARCIRHEKQGQFSHFFAGCRFVAQGSFNREFGFDRDLFQITRVGVVFDFSIDGPGADDVSGNGGGKA